MDELMQRVDLAQIAVVVVGVVGVWVLRIIAGFYRVRVDQAESEAERARMAARRDLFDALVQAAEALHPASGSGVAKRDYVIQTAARHGVEATRVDVEAAVTRLKTTGGVM